MNQYECGQGCVGITEKARWKVVRKTGKPKFSLSKIYSASGCQPDHQLQVLKIEFCKSVLY